MVVQKVVNCRTEPSSRLAVVRVVLAQAPAAPRSTRRLKWCANHRCVTPWGSGGGSRGMVLPVANASLSSKARADSWITRKRWRSSTSGWASNLSMWSAVPRGVVGFEVILGVYSPLSMAAMGSVSRSG